MPENIQLPRCLLNECYCGRGIFETDGDLRTLNNIIEGIAYEIWANEEPEREWWLDDCPIVTSADILSLLNTVVFEQCWDRWATRDEMENQLILFVALAMLFGADVEEEQREMLGRIYKQHLYSWEQKHQFKLALWIYEDGEPFKHFHPRFTLDDVVSKIVWSVKWLSVTQDIPRF